MEDKQKLDLIIEVANEFFQAGPPSLNEAMLLAYLLPAIASGNPIPISSVQQVAAFQGLTVRLGPVEKWENTVDTLKSLFSTEHAVWNFVEQEG